MTRRGLMEEERFWSHVRKTVDCWLWIGAVSKFGHGAFHRSNRQRVDAHRYAYECHHGRIPAGLVVRHLCNNAGCVNPSHLALGTHADNVADRVQAGRSAIGQRNGRSVLTPSQVIEIYRRCQSGDTKAQLAREFRVDRKTIREIVNGDTWRYLRLLEKR